MISRKCYNVIIVLLLLMPVVFAQDLLAAWPNWLTWSAIIIGIACLFLGIAFMVSRIFAIPSLEAWVKEELGDIIFSVFLVIMFSAFAGTIEAVSSNLASDILQTRAATGAVNFWSYKDSGRWEVVSTSSPSCPYPCHIYIARGFLGSTYEMYAPYVMGIAKEHATSTLLESLNIGAGMQLAPYVLVSTINIAIPIYPGRAIYNNTLGVLLTEMFKIIGLIKFQEIALVYLSKLSALLFVSGVLLRIPFFTRKLGGLLLALGIGLYAIFPLMYVLAWYTMDRSTAILGDTQASIIEELSANSAGWSKLGDFGVPSGVKLLFTSYDASGKEIQIGLIDVIGRGYALTLILPLLSIFATLGFVRHFSPMIGGDTEIAGLTKLI